MKSSAVQPFASTSHVLRRRSRARGPPSRKVPPILNLSHVITCASAIGHLTIDRTPQRAPFAAFDAVASIASGKRFVEIGGRHGELIECVSRVTRSAFSVEMNTEYCPTMEKRAKKSNGRFSFACVRFPSPLVPPADVYFAWVPDRYNMAIVAGFLQGLQARTVPSGATLVLGFAHAMKQELDCWRVLQPYATGQHTLWFNEGKRYRESGYVTLGLWSTLEPDMLRQLHQADTNADCPCSTRKIWGGCAEDVAKATKEGRQPGGSRTALERGAKGKAATHVNHSTWRFGGRGLRESDTRGRAAA